MRMPGFTAEESMCRRSQSFRVQRTINAVRHGQEVIPQIWWIEAIVELIDIIGFEGTAY
jgi:hypothetical protein